MAAGGTSGYFGDQTRSESKKPCFPFPIRFYHFWRTPLSQPLLDQSDQSAQFYFTCYLRRSRHLLDISRTFEITVSVFHHNFKGLNLDFCSDQTEYT
jgi:hypothetical protein